MNILHVFPFFSRYGGTENLIYRLCAALSQKGHKVTIFTGDYRFDKEYANSLQNVRVVPFKSCGNFGFYFMPGMIAQAKAELKNVDIIHMHCYRSFQNVVIHHYAQSYGIPYVLDAHGSVPRHLRKRRLKRLFDAVYGRRILRDASRCISESRTGIGEYEGLGVDRDKISELTPPFAVEQFSELPQRGRFRRDFGIKERHIVLFLGRINQIKGLDFVVKSFGRLAGRRRDVVLILMGPDEGYGCTLRKLIASLHLSHRVLFTGFVSHEAKLSALVDADVLVQTSRYEHGAGVPIESILCGTAVIVSTNSGTSEIVGRIDGAYLVEYGNEQELEEKMAYVLDHPREASCKTARAKNFVIENLSMQKKVLEYEGLYEHCIQQNGAR
jgi:glycosyltransferase involved in cell wall biosynthesis